MIYLRCERWTCEACACYFACCMLCFSSHQYQEDRNRSKHLSFSNKQPSQDEIQVVALDLSGSSNTPHMTNVINEIIDTERAYLKDLERIVEVMMVAVLLKYVMLAVFFSCLSACVRPCKLFFTCLDFPTTSSRNKYWLW